MKSILYPAKTSIPGSFRISLLLFLLSFSFVENTRSQTLPLSFTQISANEPDIVAPGRGAEQWHNGMEGINNPGTVTVTQSLDVYHRFTWNRLEGATQGSYTWTYFDDLVQDAINLGQKISFGIMTCYMDGEDQPGIVEYDDGYSAYPEYLHDLMQSEPANSQDWKMNGSWVPNWNSANYLGRLRALHEALYSHIISTSYTASAGPHIGQSIQFKDAIYCIDIRGFGNYGEWTSDGIVDNHVSEYPAGRMATATTLKTIIDHHTEVFDLWPLTIMIAAFDAEQMDKIMVPAEVGHYALTTGNDWGPLGWRRDQWGATDSYLDLILKDNDEEYLSGQPLNNFIMTRYLSAPITGEPPRYENNDGPTRYWDLERQITEYHATSFGNGNWGITMDANAQSNARSAFKKAGYRIILEGGNLSSTISTGTPFSINLQWKNIGIAPAYENWKVYFELKNSSDVTVWTGESQFTPSRKQTNDTFDPLQPGESNSITDNFTLPGSITTGNYKLNLIIKDPNGYRAPLPLAIEGRNPDGSYTLARIGVNIATATIKGAVNLQGRPAPPNTQWVVPLQVELYTESNSTLVNTYSVSTDQNGLFTISGITPGVYHIGVKNSHTLKRINLSVPLFGGDNLVIMGEMIEADANNDNFISNNDYDILISTFYLSEMDPEFDARADFNEDGSVDIFDFSLYLNSVNKLGDNITAGCTLVTAAINHTSTCEGQPFDLTLASASGASPYDLIVNGTTYDNIAVNGTILTYTPQDQHIWTTNPTVTSNATGNAVELGVKFKSTVSGYIKGIRFFSPAAVSGTYTGHLWAGTGGTPLASATFTNVTAGGWQEVLFTTPVQISANTTYIASYHTTTGRYASTTGGLTNAVQNGSLQALSNAASGGNGVFANGASAFPSSSANGINFWVDVVFIPDTYTFNLMSVTDDNGCNNTRELQTLVVVSNPCTSGRPAYGPLVTKDARTDDRKLPVADHRNSLKQNYPNPFSNETIISFNLAKKEKVRLYLFDVQGRLVRLILEGIKEAGTHSVNFIAASLAPGVYFYKIIAGNYSEVRKMTVQ